MKKLPHFNLSDEAEIRAFYASCGISKRITEAAIRLRLSPPVEQQNKPSLLKGKPERKKQNAVAR